MGWGKAGRKQDGDFLEWERVGDRCSWSGWAGNGRRGWDLADLCPIPWTTHINLRLLFSAWGCVTEIIGIFLSRPIGAAVTLGLRAKPST